MAKRRFRSHSAVRSPGTLLAVVILAGLISGVALSQGWWPRRVVPPGRASAVPGDTVGGVGEEPIDAAVRVALRSTATVVKEATVPRTTRDRGQAFQWMTRVVDVKVRSSPDLTRLLGEEVTAAGGVILEQTPTRIRVGARRAGLEFVTHEIHLIPFVPAARVAIVFDDAGGNLAELEPILALGRPVTLTVLPGLRFSREVALRAEHAGIDVLLHLPLEPEDTRNPLGPGGVTSGMSDGQIAQIVAADLDTVPGAIGINNHEGSRATADERVMRAVLGVVKSRGLFFVDSLTSPHSVAHRMAVEMQIPSASRGVFLDNQNEREAIRAQVRRLITLALQRKEIVAIGHATRVTPLVLKDMLDEFDRHDIEFVPISALVK